MSFSGGQQNFARCLAVSCAGTLQIDFQGLLPLTEFASCNIHFASKSCILLYWQRYCTALKQRQVSHHFGHRPTLLVHHLFFLTYLLPYLPFSLRIGPLCFQARGHKRRPNLSFKLFQFFLSCSIFCVPDAWLFCVVVKLLTCVTRGLLYIFVWLFLTVLILFSQYYARDWLGRASPKWPILCGVGCKNLNSVNDVTLSN